MTKTLTFLMVAACVTASGQDVPKAMTRLTVRLVSPTVPKESFAAQPKRYYRAGSGYCRIEENPDPEHGIHGLAIINEPDIWMVNRLDKTARHIVDPGPTYNCRLPIFADDLPKSAADLKSPLMELEFGRELEYFKPRSAAPSPGPVFSGKPTMVYTTQAGGWQLFLFVSGNPEAPVAVARTKDEARETFWYGDHVQLPFDAKLFAKPEGVQIEEVKQ